MMMARVPSESTEYRAGKSSGRKWGVSEELNSEAYKKAWFGLDLNFRANMSQSVKNTDAGPFPQV